MQKRDRSEMACLFFFVLSFGICYTFFTQDYTEEMCLDVFK